MLGENELLERTQLRAGGLEQEQRFDARFLLSLPPIVRFQTRDQVRAGDQPRLQRSSSEGPRRLQIGCGHEHQRRARGCFHKRETEILCKRRGGIRGARGEGGGAICLPGDPSAPHHDVFLVEDTRLARRDGALGLVEAHVCASVGERRDSGGRARVIVADLHRDLERPGR
jgi:hypothetical protein